MLSSANRLLRPLLSAHATSKALLPPPVLRCVPVQHGAADVQVRSRSNRSRRGIYDGKDIRSGNNVSFSMKSTKRKFKPNVFVKRVYSEVLDEMIRFHLTTSALRSIDKAGGLDNYLLKNEFTEGEGRYAKQRILKRMKNEERIIKKFGALDRSTAAAQPPVAEG